MIKKNDRKKIKRNDRKKKDKTRCTFESTSLGICGANFQFAITKKTVPQSKFDIGKQKIKYAGENDHI